MSASPTTADTPVKAIQINGVRKAYGQQTVLDGVTLSVDRGEVFALLGPNGAGKTTLMKIIIGLTRPTEGSVKIMGCDSAAERDMVRRLVAFVPQNNNLERELSVEQSLKTYGRIYGVKDLKIRLERVMSDFRLHSIRERRIDHLSGGMARRVLIARALLADPEILLMDEPTVGLDPDIRHDIWETVTALARGGRTIFLTTHYMEEAERLCGRVALLGKGRLLAADATSEIVRLATPREGQRANLETAFLQLVGEGDY